MCLVDLNFRYSMTKLLETPMLVCGDLKLIGLDNNACKHQCANTFFD